jgi:hypothetical protein
MTEWSSVGGCIPSFHDTTRVKGLSICKSRSLFTCTHASSRTHTHPLAHTLSHASTHSHSHSHSHPRSHSRHCDFSIALLSASPHLWHISALGCVAYLPLQPLRASCFTSLCKHMFTHSSTQPVLTSELFAFFAYVMHTVIVLRFWLLLLL